MEEKKQKQVSPTWVFIIAGVLIALIGPLCIYLGMQLGKDDNEGTNNNVIDNQTVNNTTSGGNYNNNQTNNINITNESALKLVELYYPHTMGSTIYELIYTNQNTWKVEERSDDFLQQIIFDNIKWEIPNSANQDFQIASTEEFNRVKTKLFGSNIALEHKNGSHMGGCVSVLYKNNRYEKDLSLGGCGGFDTRGIDEAVVDISSNKCPNDKCDLYITLAVALYDFSEEKVYTGPNKQQVNISGVNFKASEHVDKLSKYRFYFSYDKANNNYYLNSVTHLGI